MLQVSDTASEVSDAASEGCGAAVSHPNIALIKYWGKRPDSANVPATDSLSITLDTLQTRTEVAWRRSADLPRDTLCLNGDAAPPQMLARVSRFLDLIRPHGLHARIVSRSNFPTGAGLASSASGFASLGLAAAKALGRHLDVQALSVLVRQGSGSAARSVFGGFVHMRRGCAVDGSDACAEPLVDLEHWPLQVVIAITDTATKALGSTQGMERTRHTAPYYESWLATSDRDIEVARRAVMERDFATLADVSEHSCLKMHGVAMAAQPPILYWKPATLAALQTVQMLRQAGTPVFFTIDAGPQVKAVCLPAAAPTVAAALKAVAGVRQVIVAGLGPGAFTVPSQMSPQGSGG